jgi:hypothetical protein
MSDEVTVVTVVCPTCEGRGLLTPNVECSRCDGSGQVPETALQSGEAVPDEAATTPVPGAVDEAVNPNAGQPFAPQATTIPTVATPEALAANGPVADPNAATLAPPVQPPTEPVAPVEEPTAPLAPAPVVPASGDDSSVETNPDNEPVPTPTNDQDNGGQSNEPNGSIPEPIAPAADPSTTGDPASTAASEPAPVSEPTAAAGSVADTTTTPTVDTTSASPAGSVTEPNLGADGLPIS